MYVYICMCICITMRMCVHVCACVCMYRVYCMCVCVCISRFDNYMCVCSACALCSGATVNKNNAENIPDNWGCGATKKGSMTVDLFMSLCVHHVENNLKPKGYGAGKKASILIFDGHSSRWSYAGLLYLMANNCWPFCIASHTSSWAQVSTM